jgi:hypothetical protein
MKEKELNLNKQNIILQLFQPIPPIPHTFFQKRVPAEERRRCRKQIPGAETTSSDVIIAWKRNHINAGFFKDQCCAWHVKG